MKLYATVTSERATKGQGGNEFITIELYGDDRKKPVAVIDFWQGKTGTDTHGHIAKIVKTSLSFDCVVHDETKGEKQKGGQHKRYL